MKGLTPEKARIFRIAHLENVAWILNNGLHCASSPTRDPDYRDIGNPDLIDKRAHRCVPLAPYGTLADYVPFYFTPRSPMLYNIKTGYSVPRRPMTEIAILVSSLYRVADHRRPFLFTERHAYLAASEFFDDLRDLARLDWGLLQSGDFRRDPDDPGRIERYQAEALVYQHLPLEGLTGIAVYGPAQEAQLRELAQRAGVAIQVAQMREWYF